MDTLEFMLLGATAVPTANLMNMMSEKYMTANSIEDVRELIGGLKA